MASIVNISNTASAFIVTNPEGGDGNINVITLAQQIDGDVTAGTLTVRARGPRARDFEDIVDSAGAPINVIDLSAPERLSFEGVVGDYEFTAAGVTSTASELTIVLESYPG